MRFECVMGITRWNIWLVAVTVCLCSGIAAAQTQAVAAEPQTVAAEPRESEEETIGRCIRDLKSQDVIVRRRAAMLLGKYSVPEARAALVECLHDVDAKIRLGALVSLTEDHQRLPEESSGEVVRLLSDEDVHIRRLASSLLPSELSGFHASRVIIRGNVRINRGDLVTDEQREAILKALKDNDASVRRNVLNACRICGIDVPHEVLRRFLSDSSAEIRLLALQLYSRYNEQPAGMLDELSKLAKDPVPQVRLELCHVCRMLGAEGEPLLRGFLADDSADVRMAAIGQLTRMRAPGMLEHIVDAISDKELSMAHRRQLVDLLRLFPMEQARPVYQKILDGDSAELAGLAMKWLSSTISGVADVSFFTKYLEHENTTVANYALQGLRGRLKQLKLADITAMLASRNRAAREFAVRQGLEIVDKDAAGELLLEACMDEDPMVRLAAIQQVGRKRPEGWKDILTATLEDGDPKLQETAAFTLCSVREPDVIAALRNYLPRCTNRMLENRIRGLLRLELKKSKLK